MGVEENDVRPISPDVQSEAKAEEEPIEQVFSQEPEYVTTVEPSIESEDQETFEETAKFEEELDTPKVEPKSQQKKARKVTRKSPSTSGSEGKPISRLQTELRKHSDARKKTDLAILDIRKELKDLLLVHHATIKDLKKQVTQMQRKIATIDSSRKSTRAKATGKNTATGKKTSSTKKQKKSTDIGKNKRKR
jgi:hypothetical protein